MSSPAMKARVAGAFYAAVVVTSLVGFMVPAAEPFHRLGLASNLLSASATIVVTVLLYEIFKPVNGTAALLMAAFNLVGVAHSENSLAFFGCYCVLLGYLIYKSGFMPKAVGVVMVLAGIGWPTHQRISQVLHAVLGARGAPICLRLRHWGNRLYPVASDLWGQRAEVASQGGPFDGRLIAATKR